PQFDFELRSDNLADGIPGDILIIIGDFTNLSNEPIDVLITREQDNIPSDWNSALCLDICLPPSVNQTVWTLNPGEDESFSMYFFTSLDTEGSGNTLISFVNMADTSNNFTQDYFGMTEFISTSVEAPEQQIEIEVFPNPAMDFIQVRFPNQARLSANGGQINLISLTGRLVGSFPFRENENIPVNDLPKGHYLLQYSDEDGNKFTNRFVKM
ncbi:MAG: T9SS type A sorting domain-containing protein, partial [Bacteroidota bacterium]